MIVLAVAAAAALPALAPARLAADGRLDLSDLLRLNPQAEQEPSFYDDAHPLAVTLPAGMEVGRRLWLGPGTYDLRVDATAAVTLVLDDRTVVLAPDESVPVDVRGHLHRLQLRSPAGAVLHAVVIRARKS